jgi:hypothetical protein
MNHVHQLVVTGTEKRQKVLTHFFLATKILVWLTDFNILKPGYSICSTCCNTLKLCILPTQCVCVFRMVLTINSDCFPKQH